MDDRFEELNQVDKEKKQHNWNHIDKQQLIMSTVVDKQMQATTTIIKDINDDGEDGIFMTPELNTAQLFVRKGCQ